MTTLKINQLKKIYKGREVVKNISMTIHSGDIIGLLGPNGAGKTTSFYMIVGLIPPDYGTVCLDDENITHYPIHKRARLGLSYLPQEKSIFRHLSVEDNIMAILQLHKTLTKKEQQAKLASLLEEFHIEHLRHMQAISLSGGETRRVEIARALAIDPEFILLDEPFAGIDPISVVDIKQIITHLQQRGIGILITDHNVRETLDICHYANIVNEGEVIAVGTPDEILHHSVVRKVYLGEDFNL